jgi:hypothetical protein
MVWQLLVLQWYLVLLGAVKQSEHQSKLAGLGQFGWWPVQQNDGYYMFGLISRCSSSVKRLSVSMILT